MCEKTCGDNTECSGVEMCEKEKGDCVGTSMGHCVAKPSECANETMPVMRLRQRDICE
jgi:hypothetical protein